MIFGFTIATHRYSIFFDITRTNILSSTVWTNLQLVVYLKLDNEESSKSISR